MSRTHNQVVYSDHPAGGGWTAPVALPDPAQGAGPPVVAVDAHGDAFAAWSQGNGNDIRIRASYRSAGGSWQATPDVLSAPNVVSVTTAPAVDGSGDEAIGWVQNDSGSRTRRCTATTGPPEARGRHQRSCRRRRPRSLVEQSAGTLDSQGSATSSGSTRQPEAIPRSRRRRTPSRRGSGVCFPGVLSNTSHDSIGPQIASDHLGDLTTAWQDSTTGQSRRSWALIGRAE